MSNQTNDNFVEEAMFYMDFFTGTIMEKLLEWDIHINDMESLYQHLSEARKAAFDIQYQPEVSDVY